ncbi:MAG TPA: bifunctional diaminohydroxyphosphoribosylaminopyrimidine deaminase/5-amino-6-(5-phosphoribosylamino)uracil reductase RibD [Vitreimonas sp.]|uniref:bifunctional diaminohydroxyphosphoribosylaminopyrimidine deaminase/5-amino-6-(5-phosphoribosylamino)uracil reductase RibD n=1 Tax=Vitreimonas sp. TaxID=3069702 RepID=UPI002D607D4A|nr:bifunctional diaminohydroxyphosphoribosylaminopyrimidine deaminase/5-amino-6-(5-phosphoribosylamino)uracil reductase RibD [Vitreimonas sp.]HYD87579.1 bifunctional diaminohydroxyphosphoribosylaminopyrimidine deaminase/5-amino-6-(5-phosphoribosylamino)uracil reductase RibD [Vitreimonas sp.]
MSDLTFMQRALALAAPGVGRTGENPSVGCVIVRDGMIVGEGATAIGGRPHAEHVALARSGDEAIGADVYVTLEPCASRSVPGTACADLLIQARVARVIVGARDPHPHANGAGLERLRAAGIAIETGVMAEEARAQNAGFFAKWDVR